ncbi:hypothetical protein HDV05_001942 [Chytridiales sp. JEL 0842]|nr:hypothetical protein HDV05_001942 [Chytridiales sp. JEL 0842]
MDDEEDWDSVLIPSEGLRLPMALHSLNAPNASSADDDDLAFFDDDNDELGFRLDESTAAGAPPVSSSPMMSKALQMLQQQGMGGGNFGSITCLNSSNNQGGGYMMPLPPLPQAAEDRRIFVSSEDRHSSIAQYQQPAAVTIRPKSLNTSSENRSSRSQSLDDLRAFDVALASDDNANTSTNNSSSTTPAQNGKTRQQIYDELRKYMEDPDDDFVLNQHNTSSKHGINSIQPFPSNDCVVASSDSDTHSLSTGGKLSRSSSTHTGLDMSGGKLSRSSSTHTGLDVQSGGKISRSSSTNTFPPDHHYQQSKLSRSSSTHTMEFDLNDDLDALSESTFSTTSSSHPPPLPQQMSTSTTPSSTTATNAPNTPLTMLSSTLFQLSLKRFQPSPTPSSNASVIASEGEEEGFDDIEFPDSVGSLKFHGTSNFNDGEEGLETGEGGRSQEFFGVGVEMERDGVEEDEDMGFLIPEDFKWTKRVNLESAAAETAGVTKDPTVVRPVPLVLKLERKPSTPNLNSVEKDTGNDDDDDNGVFGMEDSVLQPPPALKAFEPFGFLEFQRSKQAPSIPPPNVPQHKPPSTTVDTSKQIETTTRKVPARPIIKASVGDMIYNPLHQKWEGNEQALLDFEKSISSNSLAAVTRLRPPKKPALITNRGGSKVEMVVGSMVFDPVQMRWVNNGEDGEEEDVFAGIDDEGFSGGDSNDSIKAAAPPPSYPELNLTKSLKQSLYITESAHKLFIGKWYPKAIMDSRSMGRGDTSKVHLHEIRQMNFRI